MARFTGEKPTRLDVDRFIAAHYLKSFDVEMDYSPKKSIGKARRKNPPLLGLISKDGIRVSPNNKKLSEISWFVPGAEVLHREIPGAVEFCLQGIYNPCSLYKQVIQAFPDVMESVYFRKLPDGARWEVEDYIREQRKPGLGKDFDEILLQHGKKEKGKGYTKPLAPVEKRLEEIGF